MSYTELSPVRQPRRVTVVLPVFNEAPALTTLHAEVSDTLAKLGVEGEIIYVDDGSTDGTAQALDELAGTHEGVTVIHLTRNFGHQAAVQAGLERATGDAVVVMDSDLQDDPRSIPLLLEPWKKGYDVVYAVRVDRKEGVIKRTLFRAYYRILGRVSTIAIPKDAGNFGLIDRRVAREVTSLADRDRYYPGLRSWVGHRQCGVEIERGPRYDARPRVSTVGLCRLAKSAVFSFSSVPLAVFYGIALLSLLAFVVLWAFVLYHKLWTHRAVPAWTSTIMTASFFGCLNALGIAILGEYVLRIYDQVRGRPLFLIERIVSHSGTENRDSRPTPDKG